MTLQEAKLKFSSLDWNYFDSQGFPDLALMIRMASDYYFQESMAEGNEKNNRLIAKAQALGNRLVGLIPVVGDILGFILDGTGIDFTIFGSLQDSGTAKQRMFDWVHTLDGSQGFSKIYESGLDYLTNDTVYPSNVQVVFSQVGTQLANARPKCVSPTSGCTAEHQKYIFRTHICKESQEAVIQLYLNNFNREKFSEFVALNKKPVTPGELQSTVSGTPVAGGALLIIGLSLLSKIGH